MVMLSSIPSADAGILERFKLTASDAAEGDRFGSPVAISGNTGIVGARFKEDPRGWLGSAYLFDVTTGQELFKLTSSGPGNDLGVFGASVAIDGATALVGEPHGDAGGVSAAGAAYLFDAATGQELFRLTASDAAEDDIFGGPVAIDGNRAIVGAPFDDDAGDKSGAAYVFDVTTGQEIMKLTAADASAEETFGMSVAISGNTAIVGASRFGASAHQPGSAYLFDITTGQQLFKLTASDAVVRDSFGASVSIDGGMAVVGAFTNWLAGNGAGAAYLFDATTGQEIFKFTASDIAPGDNFGNAVSIDGNAIAIGSASANPANAGAAYLFDAATGEELLKLLASDAAPENYLGASVGISGNRVIAGASGAAYLFVIPEPSSFVLAVLGIAAAAAPLGLRLRADRKRGRTGKGVRSQIGNLGKDGSTARGTNVRIQACCFLPHRWLGRCPDRHAPMKPVRFIML